MYSRVARWLASVTMLVTIWATPSLAAEPEPDEDLLEFLGGVDSVIDAESDEDWVEFLAKTEVKRAATKVPPAKEAPPPAKPVEAPPDE